MLTASFVLAARSPSRQSSFRRLVAAHLAVVVGVLAVMAGANRTDVGFVVANVLLLAGIVEGAVLVGWRLTQLPRSQALEFLLVSPQSPPRVFASEALVGLARLALVTLAGLPVLALLVFQGVVTPLTVVPLLLMPWTWGAVTGLGLAAWAYEPLAVRRWGERVGLALVVVYLIVGVLGGEQLTRWAVDANGDWVVPLARAGYDYNPFGVLRGWLVAGEAEAWPRAVVVELVALAAIAAFGLRAARRLLGHFHERHYTPLVDRDPSARRRVDDRPLAWWAVKRVTHYSGRINVWIAAGFGVLYAAYVVAGPAWPPWLGRRAFDIFDNIGGLPSVATGLVLLAAVPAAFQYGLWDSNAQDRCRRLELLLLTRLTARDYWDAAAAAAWKRGQVYFCVAGALWLAALIAGRATAAQAAAALAAAALLWCLYFAIGFRAFARGMQANGLGMLLTVGLPLVAAWFAWSVPEAAALLPPGAVYAAASRPTSLLWALGPAATSLMVFALARLSLACCDADLRQWYEKHHGLKGMS